MKEIIEKAMKLTGCTKYAAQKWYREHPLMNFGGKTAKDLVEADMAGSVHSWLDHHANEIHDLPLFKHKKKDESDEQTDDE